MTIPTTPSVLIVDDQDLVRSGIRMILERNGLPVTGEAADGNEAITHAGRQPPDIILMDIQMPGLDGLEATRRLLDSRHAVSSKIIILTTFDLDRYVYAALRAGASGFLLKDSSPEQLVAAIRLVATGEALLAPAIMRRLITRFAAQQHPAQPAGDLNQLTPRELEVLTLVATGLSNTEISGQLFLAEPTVKTHVAHIFAKLQLRDRAQAVILAYETGLIAPGGSEASPTTTR